MFSVSEFVKTGGRFVCNTGKRLANASLNYSLESRLGAGSAMFMGGLVGGTIIAETHHLTLDRNRRLEDTRGPYLGKNNHSILFDTILFKVAKPVTFAALTVTVPEFTFPMMAIGFLAAKHKIRNDQKELERSRQRPGL